MSKYTPGPWRAEGFCVKEKNSFSSVIAECTDFKGNGLANVQLISAAPEMLEALRNIHSLWFGDNANIHQYHLAIQDISKQAITKAEGDK